MSELVVVYHRQPFEERIVDGEKVLRSHRSPNGIVPSLRGFFQYFDQGSWVAWTEVAAEQAGQLVSNEAIDFAGEHYNMAQVGLTAAQVNSFYKVTSKAALWPILHSFPERFDYDAADWETFREVNQIFANAACKVASEGALVWVHDYNLWLVPQLVRDQRPDLKIAFFHHTPFPASDIFGILPWRKEIMESLLCCDRVGFHIPRYAENFSGAARAFAAARGNGRDNVISRMQPEGWALQETSYVRELEWRDRKVAIDISPLGVNCQKIRRIASEAQCDLREKEIRKELSGQRILFSVGRVDYTKGTLEMLQAYERLLQRRPELLGKIKLCVTSVKAASGMAVYDDYLAEVEQRVGSINGHYARLDWSPILLFTQPLPFDELISWYRAADICLVTPLRDGLNLVAKEFVVAKQGKPGVLLLSEFCGSAVELGHAVLTHPYSHRSMDAAMDKALDMNRDDARNRMQAMLDMVEKHGLGAWTEDMLKRFGIEYREPLAHSA